MMLKRVTHLSPHQNGKVFAVLMAVFALVLILPFALLALVFVPGARSSAWPFILLPVVYLVFGYLSTALWCWYYNVMVRFVGGFEFESRPEAA